MAYENKTKRVDLGDGQWAEFFQELRHGTQKAVNLMTRPFMEYPDGNPPKLAITEGETPKVEGANADGKIIVKVDMAKVDFDAVNDLIIVGQVKEWSFGEVNQATLDGLPESIRTKLKTECDGLYGTTGPLPKGGDGN